MQKKKEKKIKDRGGQLYDDKFEFDFIKRIHL